MKHNTASPSVPMRNPRRFFHRAILGGLGISLCILTFLAITPQANAQVVVRLRMNKKNYILNEPVTATVYITNHAGRQLVFRGQGSRAWLNFHLTSGNRVIPTAHVMEYKPVVIPAGQTVTRKIFLSAIYSLGRMANYTCTCSVNMPGSARNGFSSNRTLFNITYGKTVWVQRAGIPSTLGQVLEYKLIIFSGNGSNELYAEVSSVKTGRNIATMPLGKILTFGKPTGTLDAENNLHALYQVKPNIFAHTCIVPTGRVKFSEYHKRGITGTPRLIFVAGAVRVAGSVPYDRAAEAAIQRKIHKISERPSFIYR